MALFSSKRSDNQALSHFLSNSPWLYRNLSRSIRTKAIEIIGTNGAIILDESGMKKSGDSSVGVSRQYCGNLGKVENCQVGVFLAYSKGNKRTLIDFRLYLPENWVEDKERCLTGVSTLSHKTASKDTFFVGSNTKLIMLIKIPKVLILNSNI